MKRLFCILIAFATIVSLCKASFFHNVAHAEGSSLVNVTIEGSVAMENEKTALLTAMNKLRKEAYNNGYPDPDNPGAKLKGNDYRPLTWNTELEQMAIQRAAEGIVEQNDKRPNGKANGTISINGVFSDREETSMYWVTNSEEFSLYDLANMLSGAGGEMERWKTGNYSADDSAVARYAALISPKNRSIGSNYFQVSNATIKTPTSEYENKCVTCAVCEYSSSQAESTDYSEKTGVVSQSFDILPRYIESINIYPSGSASISVGESKQLSLFASVHVGRHDRYRYEIYLPNVMISPKSATWNSDDSDLFSVDNMGKVLGIEPGEGTVSASINGKSASAIMKIVGDASLHTHKLIVVEGKTATCLEAGVKKHWKCEKCGKLFADDKAGTEIGRSDIVIKATGHFWDDWVITKEATETEEGIKTRVCKNDSNHKETQIIPKKGTQIEIIPKLSRGGRVSPEVAKCEAGATQEFVVTPDEGYVIAHIYVDEKDIGARNSFAVSNLSSATTIEIVFEENLEPEQSNDKSDNSKNPFEDVSNDKYYYNAAVWAANTGVTSGIDATHFGPNQQCTRAQVMTFLWKANGSPEPNTTINPFTDVHTNNYYYKPVLWAVENGITTGTTATTFSPNAACTRGQVVTFIWHSNGNPQLIAKANPFGDVKSTNYYYYPVMWAIDNGITSGTTEKTFSPNQTCTRAQIVTFIWKSKESPKP